jgi:hypothetical protein
MKRFLAVSILSLMLALAFATPFVWAEGAGGGDDEWDGGDEKPRIEIVENKAGGE